MSKVEKTSYWNRLSEEEKWNTITHFFPFLATVGIAFPLIVRAIRSQQAAPEYQILGTVLFIAGMILMFGSSTVYHAVTEPKTKARLRVLDHIAIYAMIAGSYSLICLSVVGGRMGWSLFIFLWTCVIAGVIGKIVALGKYPKLSLALYLCMGWVAVVILVPMWRGMSHATFWWIVSEGVFYTIGSYFFNKDEEHAFYHAIWHVFITLGAASHTIATWLILS